MKKIRARRSTTGASLTGKVAVVTGASRGIGQAVVDALADVQCTVIAASRNISAGQKHPEVRQPKTANRSQITEIQCDVRDERSVARLFAQVKKQFGRIDILVNNAGIAHPMRSVEELPVDRWREVIDTNLTGMFLCTRSALPLMRRGGVIVNNLSVAARGVFAGESAYCASKHGALGFTETLREELRERGIRVLSLLPGPTSTDLWDQFWPEAPRDKMMSPETVARAVVNAIMLPENASVEELRIAPTNGRL